MLGDPRSAVREELSAVLFRIPRRQGILRSEIRKHGCINLPVPFVFHDALQLLQEDRALGGLETAFIAARRTCEEIQHSSQSMVMPAPSNRLECTPVFIDPEKPPNLSLQGGAIKLLSGAGLALCILLLANPGVYKCGMPNSGTYISGKRTCLYAICVMLKIY